MFKALNVLDVFGKMFQFPYVSYFAEDGDGGGESSNDSDSSDSDSNGKDAEKADEDLDWIKERGAKNVRSELTRKSDELKRLREENENLKKPKEPVKTNVNDMKYPPEIQEYYDSMVNDYKLDPGYVKKTCDTMMKVAVNASREISGKTVDEKLKPFSKIQQKHLKEDLNDSIGSIKGDKKLKSIVELYEDEIRDYAIKEIDPKYWGDEKVIKSIVGLISINHTGETKNDNTPSRKVNETENFVKSNSSSGITAEEMQDYADEHNLDLSLPEVRKSVLEGVIAKNKALKRLE